MSQPLKQIPLLERALDDVIAWDASRSISCAQFLHDVAAITAQLESKMADKKYAVNLCTERYAFMVTFAAVICRGQTNLLPPNQAIDEVQSIANDYEDSYFIVNNYIDGLSQQQFKVSLEPIYSAHSAPTYSIPEIDYKHIAAITFTSGSSGEPATHLKQWGDIITCARFAATRFKLDSDIALVSTVPSQHMYGLETTILFPLVAPVAVYNGQPFYPEDIRRAVAAADKAVVLITTPIHLRACVKANLNWQNIKFIISAAAVLPLSLAKEVMESMQASVFEIYGCTEAGSMATRETLKEKTWLPYPGQKFYKYNDSYYLNAIYLPEPVELSDKLKIHANGSIELLGRNSDVVKIAGKRGHIGDLNNKLVQIKGVQAGVFFQPDEKNATANGVSRLTAFVVAPDIEITKIVSELGKKIDPVFIPRPLYKIESLPFTDTGKLPRTVLQALYNKLHK